ncbi:sll1863 family stress response protein [Desulfosporosinus fructosivorans]
MEKRNVYLEKLEANLEKYNAKLDMMKAEAVEAKDDMKSEYLSQMSNLEKKRDTFMVKYGELKKSSEQGWEDVKAGTEKAWSELEDSVKKSFSRFK